MKYRFQGEMTVPGDKSIAHRAIILGALAKGVTQISNFSFSEDLSTTVKLFQDLGVKMHIEPTTKDMIIKGSNHEFNPITHNLNLNNVGELQSLIMGMLSTIPDTYTLSGGKFLDKRPFDNLALLLTDMGVGLNRLSSDYLPLEITGSNKLQGITYQQDIASAQIKSGLIFASLYADSKTEILRKMPTRNHTEVLANYFGADIVTDQNVITVNPKNTQLIGQNLTIPGDFSSAAFYIVGALLAENSHLVLRHVGLNSTRIGLLDVIKQMGGNIEITNRSNNSVEPFGDLTIVNQKLHSTTIGAKQVPFIIDEIPLIALMASQASGETIIEDVHDVHLQMSDRITNMRVELAKLGIIMTVNDDSIVIKGNQTIHVKDDVDSHDDHRIAMMLCIASNLIDTPFQIKNIEAIDISYPDFISDMKKVLFAG
ncbi:3-phosphoshikimate 1-carboxyvinyltransferase [Companilactobacillus allii]|uniref:3-phosphoshikimate 1-carboxyvinyltransferase n=2 Tax=Companilactobacillus allii TaxID=1847728 RepID=A0A1P8Q6B7_9LACO|nr:3-phosphoshikimate 1-carboxyvinyltransferase [Companilactobacillus allii]APX73404.1 3-phosphoshikimate 1-carboxyvinyltransferase [Companilactobacillus allii]USQ67786.1 3-phosphoshikimate 1-carboxyvinyltransferase [Companilactobacillus allii]